MGNLTSTFSSLVLCWLQTQIPHALPPKKNLTSKDETRLTALKRRAHASKQNIKDIQLVQVLLSQSGNRTGLALTTASCQKWCQNISKALGNHGSPVSLNRVVWFGVFRYADCTMLWSVLCVACYLIWIQAPRRLLSVLCLYLNVCFMEAGGLPL